MSIIVICPACHRQNTQNKKKCSCGCDLQKAKKNRLASLYVAYRLPGSSKLFREPAGTDISEAKDLEAKIRMTKKAGNMAALSESRNITFSELSEWYLGLETNRELAHYGAKKIHIEKFNADFGDRRVNTLLPADIENYQIQRRKEGESDSYIDQQVATVRHMVSKSVDNNMVSIESLKPFRKVRKLLKRNANARDKVLSESEYERLYNSAPAHLKPVIATAYYTGMRKGEILNLTWDRVFLKERLIRLRKEDTKDNESRNIPLCAELINVFMNIPRFLHIREVFLYRGKPLMDIRSGLREACKKAGIEYGRGMQNGFTFHDLRHTFVTNSRRAGVPEPVIMAITGHSTREMFDRYNTVDVQDIKDAVDRVFKG